MSETCTAKSAPMIEAPMELRFASGGSTAKNAFIVCAKCNAPAVVRTSQWETPLVKHLFCLCTNPGCGHTFKMELAFIYSLSPGSIDRPDLNLPECPKDQLIHVLPPPRGGEEKDQMSMFEPDSG